MGPIESISTVFRNYVNFSGRAQRSQFWWFILFAWISSSILSYIPLTWNSTSISSFIPIVGQVYSLALILPSLAVTVRRLHDTNRSGWWLLAIWIPVLGGLIIGIGMAFWAADESGEFGVFGLWFLLTFGLFGLLVGAVVSLVISLVLLVPAGTAGPNSYGPDPLQPEVDDYRMPNPAGTQPASEQSCTQCGTQLQTEAQFCSVCGTIV